MMEIHELDLRAVWLSLGLLFGAAARLGRIIGFGQFHRGALQSLFTYAGEFVSRRVVELLLGKYARLQQVPQVLDVPVHSSP